jgi:hypothetical protein
MKILHTVGAGMICISEREVAQDDIIMKDSRGKTGMTLFLPNGSRPDA